MKGQFLTDIQRVEQLYYEGLGSEIRNKRRLREFSQEYMAYKLNISQNTYCKIESGRCRCTVYRLVQIALLLEIDPEELLKYDYGIQL